MQGMFSWITEGRRALRWLVLSIQEWNLGSGGAAAAAYWSSSGDKQTNFTSFGMWQSLELHPLGAWVFICWKLSEIFCISETEGHRTKSVDQRISEGPKWHLMNHNSYKSLACNIWNSHQWNDWSLFCLFKKSLWGKVFWKIEFFQPIFQSWITDRPELTFCLVTILCNIWDIQSFYWIPTRFGRICFPLSNASMTKLTHLINEKARLLKNSRANEMWQWYIAYKANGWGGLGLVSTLSGTTTTSHISLWIQRTH